MKIEIGDGFYLGFVRAEDAPLYVEYFLDPQIYENTLRIPSPYSLQDAHDFVKRVGEQAEKLGHPTNLAIRDSQGTRLIPLSLNRAKTVRHFSRISPAFQKNC